MAAPNVYCVANMWPQPHSSIATHRFGLPYAFIRREIQARESSEADVEGDDALKTTLSAPCSAAMRRRLAATRSSASSQVMRCQPGSGSPLGRVRFIG